MGKPRAEQYVVVVISEDMSAQAFGPFRNWAKASKITDRINDADDGMCETNALLLTLDRPTETLIKDWIKEEDEDAEEDE